MGQEARYLRGQAIVDVQTTAAGLASYLPWAAAVAALVFFWKKK